MHKITVDNDRGIHIEATQVGYIVSADGWGETSFRLCEYHNKVDECYAAAKSFIKTLELFLDANK